jgi:hypothetical protein
MTEGSKIGAYVILISLTANGLVIPLMSWSFSPISECEDAHHLDLDPLMFLLVD